MTEPRTSLAGFCGNEGLISLAFEIQSLNPREIVDSGDCGDGKYPVFVDRNEDGKAVELRIAFDGIRHDDYKVMMDQEEKEGII
jgi:hypothetical protein|tara:strand:- start:1778 stop:2029 length:252 start_codon:yes stop_codon:yes gene_type:complete